MKKLFVSQQGNQYGPWSVDEILQKIEQKKLQWTDYVYDEQSADWVLLAQYPEFASKLMTDKPKGLIVAEKGPVQVNNSKEWYVLRDNSKQGPFYYLEILQMLQDKKLCEYDYVWNQGLTSWKKISTCAEFSPDRVKELKNSGKPEIDEVFFRRRHMRAGFGSSVIVHNNKNVWKGQGFEIGQGGAGLILEFADLQPGQSLFLHVKAGDDVPPFNAICNVVGKQSIKGIHHKMKYSVQFTTITKNVQLAIKNFTESKKVA